jgi:hypothetical protein
MGDMTTRTSDSHPSPARRVRVTKHLRVRTKQRGLSEDVREFMLDALAAGRFSETRPAWTFWKGDGRNRENHQRKDIYLWDEAENFCIVAGTGENTITLKTALRRRVAKAVAA